MATITINDLIEKARLIKRLFKNARTFSCVFNEKVVKFEISPYTICANASNTFYVRILSGLPSNHQLVTFCENYTKDFQKFNHYGGYIEELNGCLAVTVFTQEVNS